MTATTALLASPENACAGVTSPSHAAASMTSIATTSTRSFSVMSSSDATPIRARTSAISYVIGAGQSRITTLK